LEIIELRIAAEEVVLGIKDEYPIKIYQQRPNLTKTIIVVGGKPQLKV
jgi:hypothetical protein